MYTVYNVNDFPLWSFKPIVIDYPAALLQRLQTEGGHAVGLNGNNRFRLFLSENAAIGVR